jgi:hypothetical protein
MGNPRTSHGGFSLQSHGNVYMGIFLMEVLTCLLGKSMKIIKLNGVFFQQSMLTGG